jgi:hypothetical protein
VVEVAERLAAELDKVGVVYQIEVIDDGDISDATIIKSSAFPTGPISFAVVEGHTAEIGTGTFAVLDLAARTFSQQSCTRCRWNVRLRLDRGALDVRQLQIGHVEIAPRIDFPLRHSETASCL